MSKCILLKKDKYLTYKMLFLYIKKSLWKQKQYIKNRIIYIIRIYYIEFQYLYTTIKLLEKLLLQLVKLGKYKFYIKNEPCIKKVISNVLNKKLDLNYIYWFLVNIKFV